MQGFLTFQYLRFIAETSSEASKKGSPYFVSKKGSPYFVMLLDKPIAAKGLCSDGQFS
jgi:hypothetical protein